MNSTDPPPDDKPLDDLTPLPTAETAVLGACFLDAAAATLALEHLTPEHFKDLHHRAIFRSIQRNAPEGGVPDIVLVVDEILADPESNGTARIAANCFKNTPSAANQRFYVERVLRGYAARRCQIAMDLLTDASTSAGREDAVRRLAEAQALPLRLPVRQAAMSLPTSWDLAVLVTEPDDPPPDEFVSRLFVRPSFNIGFGPPQAGKSWAFMALCFDAVMGGGSFLGCEDLYIKPLREIRDGRDERCLWVFGNEDTRARVKRRLKTLHASGPHAGKEIPPGVFTIATPPGGLSIHSEEGWAWLLQMIETVKPTLLVLDTIASLTGNSLDVNKAEQVIPFIAKINVLRAEKNLVIFALHHTRKGAADAKKGAGSQADAMLGAGAWRALSEGVLMLDAHDGDTSKITVVSIKAKDIERPIPKIEVTLESPGGRFRQLASDEAPTAREAVAPPQKTGRPKKFSADAVLALREKNPDGFTWSFPVVGALLDVQKSAWHDQSDEVATELLNRGCVFLQGVMKWPNDGIPKKTSGSTLNLHE